MSTLYLFDKVFELKEKFKKFFTHKKKMQALDNYSSVVPFQHKDYLLLIKKCMNDGFLGEKEADFLTYMLEKYEVNFLDWSHKTRWLKGEMARLAAKYQEPQPVQTFMFDFDKLQQPMSAHVPFELLAQQQKQKMARRA